MSESEIPRTPETAHECIHDVLVWWGHECGFCMDEFGDFQWKYCRDNYHSTPHKRCILR